MDDELLSPKLILYLFYSADTEQQQDQLQLPIEDMKGRSYTGLSIYLSGLTIRSNTYGEKIKPSEFSKRLGKANQFLKQQYD